MVPFEMPRGGYDNIKKDLAEFGVNVWTVWVYMVGCFSLILLVCHLKFGKFLEMR